MMKQTTDLLIIGGGASGLAAAVAARRFFPAVSVCVAEQNHRVGKKILATGNGRCNLGNDGSGTQNNPYSGTMCKYIPEIWKNTKDSVAFFREMGIIVRHEEDGRLYPSSNQAASVLDALRITAEQEDVFLHCDSRVTNITPKKSGFSVQIGDESWTAEALLFSTGGFAAPKTGSDGCAFPILSRLGCKMTQMQPALVPVETDPGLLRFLKGVRVSGMVKALSESETELAAEQGEIQFTPHALSGICVMNLTAKCAESDLKWIEANLFPQDTGEQMEAILWELYAVRAQWKLEDWLTGLLPKKAGMQLLRSCGILLPFDAPVYRVNAEELKNLAYLCQHWRFPVWGRGTWNEAQVTAGGISVQSVKRDLQASFCPGIFFAGEILDVHGICGGFNLDWAWRSGQYAGKNAASWILQKRIGG